METLQKEKNAVSDLVNRLRGIYSIPVEDGAGPLDGKTTFVRKFEGLPPIHGEAADEIERLQALLGKYEYEETQSAKEEEDKTFGKEIMAVHPTAEGATTSMYALAMKLVSERHKKFELVNLVNWLLLEREKTKIDTK